MEGTVISDAVNVASRVEGLTKMYGVSLMISDKTFFKLKDPSRYAYRILDRVKVKGKSEVMTVYDFFEGDPPAIREAKLATKSRFEEVWLLYQHRDLQAAQSLFQECLNQHPEDKAAQIYVERCQHFLEIGFKGWEDSVSIETK